MNKKIDDVTLTSFALGELPEDQMKEIAMEVQKDPKLQEQVEQIKEVGLELETQFKQEETSRLDQKDRKKFLANRKSKGFWSIKVLAPLTMMLMLTMTTVYFFKSNWRNDKLTSITDKVFGNAEKFANEPSAPQVSMRSSSFVPKKMMKVKMAESMMFIPRQEEEFNTESYHKENQNSWIDVITQPLSTFSVDVDTASYSNTRRFIMDGRLPVKASVRIEEFINYFSYLYEAPAMNSDHPFAVHTEVSSSPWHSDYKIVRIGLKGKEVANDQRPKSNLVFLLDTSGSMHDSNKLPLLKDALKLLVTKLNDTDRVSIVTYAGSSGLVLDSVKGSEKATILRALSDLRAGGGTNGQSGIKLAYEVAQKGFIKGGVNKVLLVTDGDFNLGVTNQDALVDLIKEKSSSKIFLSILGMGRGNYKDHRMETIANKGNGNFYYLDTLNEAKKVLVNDINGTLMTIAKDVKIQVEFNPGLVEHYRLIGYENRKLAARDFNDDKKDAGEIGAGHSVTAIYEIVPKGVKFHGAKIDKLKYQKVAEAKKIDSNELMTVKLRYKRAEESKSILLNVPVSDSDKKFEQASLNTKLAVGAASFAMILRDDEEIGNMNISKAQELINESLAEDRFGYRQELFELIGIAKEVNAKQKNWK